jgi:hypothetical protein
MKFIRPALIDDTVLLSSSVPEDDALAWSADTNYAVGNVVLRPDHHLYESRVPGVDASLPEAAPLRWLDLGVSNRWRMFDKKIGSLTTAVDSITVVLAPGRINALGFIGVDAALLDVSLVVDTEEVFAASYEVGDATQVGSWYEYFFEPPQPLSSVFIPDLLSAALLDVPPYGEGVLTVTLSRPGGTVACGLMVAGMLFEIGDTEFGIESGIVDFSKKERDAYGTVDLREGEYIDDIGLTVEVPADRFDMVGREVRRVRSTPVFWIAAPGYQTFLTYGFLTEWKLVLRNARKAIFNAKIESMT